MHLSALPPENTFWDEGLPSVCPASEVLRDTLEGLTFASVNFLF